MTAPPNRLLITTAIVAVLLGLALPAAAQARPATVRLDVHAVRTARPPVIDGRLNDECWTLAQPVGDFTQQDPDEGKPATEHTEVLFLYDDDALYVGMRLFDSHPDQIVRRLSTRDTDPDADRVTLYLDPMHDRLTGAVFRVSAANVQKDSILYNDTWQDSTWDAVWQSQVAVDERGWTVEMRIPLSQLRFPQSDRQTWGVNVERYVQRKNEDSWLEMVPKAQNGLASRMLDLTGLDGLRSTHHLELLPYTAARSEFITPTAGDPFNSGARAFGSAGLDMKWGVTSNLTLNATVNPDFGQVEVDPAVVNLTQFETFFPEKRAFFLEGSQIFNNFGTGGSNSFWGFNSSDPNLFYSRRIGRAPQLTADGDFTDAPSATTILGATKLTGKTRSGWSIGLLEAVTSREEARTRTGVLNGSTIVEPFTNYGVLRAQREFNNRFGIGFLATTVNRQLETAALRSDLAQDAIVVGTDAYVFLDHHRDWVLTGKLAGSQIDGSTDAIATAQQSAQRYFQRPDAAHVHFDPTRTSLGGYNGRINLNRNSGTWQVNAALWGVSPGFESNDLGFETLGDRAGAHAVLYWRDVVPDKYSRSKYAWLAKWWVWNYNRELQGNGVNGNTGMTLRNWANINVGGGFHTRVHDDRLTRGGPSAVAPGGGFLNTNGGTDGRRRVALGASYTRAWGAYGAWENTANLSLTVKTSPRLTLSLGPQWDHSSTPAQYVATIVDPAAASTYGSRYVFGSLAQTQVSMTTRATLVLSPTVSVQVFAQPLLAAGDYSHFKELARPRTFEFLEYSAAGHTPTLDASNTYSVDPGNAPAFTFDNPDFNLRSLRLNAVFRWELKPGSALYAVWTRQQQDTADPQGFSFGRDAHAMLAATGNDVVLVKLAYWLGH